MSCAFQQCKNFENRLRFDKVTASSKVGTFLRHCVVLRCISYSIFSLASWTNFYGAHVKISKRFSVVRGTSLGTGVSSQKCEMSIIQIILRNFVLEKPKFKSASPKAQNLKIIDDTLFRRQKIKKRELSCIEECERWPIKYSKYSRCNLHFPTRSQLLYLPESKKNINSNQFIVLYPDINPILAFRNFRYPPRTYLK